MPELEQLRQSITFAHERIERLTKENWEFRLLIRALLLSHHDAERLCREIETDKEFFVSIGLGKEVPDSDLALLQERAARAISLVQSRQRGRQ